MNENGRGNSYVGVAAYLILAFGLAWGFWELFLPASAANPVLFQLILLPGAFAPALACFIVRKWITREGFGDAGLGLHLRQWRYYLIGWFLPLGVAAFVALAAPGLGIAHPDFSMTQSLARLAPHAKVPPGLHGILGTVLPLQAIVTALIATPLLFGEEFGWRGYLQLRLFPQSPTLAAIATGVIWGLWHLPVILRGYEFPGNRVVVTAVFCTGAVLVSIVFGWLRRRSGSIWATSLAHSATNAIGGSLLLLWFADQSQALLTGYLGLLSWIPLGLFAVWIVVRGDRRAPV